MPNNWFISFFFCSYHKWK